MATKLATPGVYIEEKSSFGSTVVSVPTAVPAFVGYTEKASRSAKSLLNIPTKISSFAEYCNLFGGAPETKFEVSSLDDGSACSIKAVKSTRFLMYDSLRLYFSNGGSECYIVSVGNYDSTISGKKLNDIKNSGGLASLERYAEPTIVVIPEATLLSESDCYSLQSAMLQHCGLTMRNRFAILDVYNGNRERTYNAEDVIKRFRDGVGSDHLSWGAAYYPFLNTSVVSESEVDFTNISNPESLVEIIASEVDANVENNKLSAAKAEAIKEEAAKIIDAETSDISSIQATLKTISPTFSVIMKSIVTELNVMPPSAAMAGAYSMVDNSINVAKAPANISLGSVISPVISVTEKNQEDLNTPLNGKAVNAIRSFTGKGTLVWGARTMDGNSQDWRYINVRRTMTYLEQSIKSSASGFVFSPNNSTTWSTLRATVSNFLSNQWASGLLVGASTDEAYEVQIGLGSTMTANDVLDGVLRMTVKVAVVRPAEFIVLTFEQKQQE